MKNPNMKQIMKQKTYSSQLTHTRGQLSFRQQGGFTLVEIMVAITIGLLMLAGILQISAASKESGRLQRNMSFVQENIRLSTEILGRDIRQAGYYEDDNPTQAISAGFAPFMNLSTSSTTDTTAAITADGGGGESDQITVTYESDTDCLGQDTFNVGTTVGEEANNHFAVNHYFIASERLMCRGNGNIFSQPLVEGVESMQILYGENTDGDPRSANRYVQAGEANPNNIVSVRIALRFHSREHVRHSIDNNKYALLDETAGTPAAGDERIRREVSTTISLRNSLRN
jgi:type IV pilus assembly protein PilW